MLSQNILSQLRNLTEHSALLIYSKVNKIDTLNYDVIKNAINYIKTKGNYSFITKLHHLLQVSKSHYTLSDEGAERLMLKYFEYLVLLKKMLLDEFSLDVLKNIDEFPLDKDSSMIEYYNQIALAINETPKDNISLNTDRFYVQRVKPFYIEGNVYYEVTLSPAIDNISRFDRIIMYSNQRISDYYSLKIQMRKSHITIFNQNVPIYILVNWSVSIRECEINNYGRVFGMRSTFSANQLEYSRVMKILTDSKLSLVDIVDYDEETYSIFKIGVTSGTKSNYFTTLLDTARKLIKTNSNGSRIIEYLMLHLNNRVIKSQLGSEENSKLSDLYLKNGSISFDSQPFSFSLIKHNPKLWDLLECFEITGREDEILARTLKNNTEQNGVIYTKLCDLEKFNDINTLVKKYNDKLIPYFDGEKIIVQSDYCYIRSYEENTISIINKLIERTNLKLKGYKNSVISWLSTTDLVQCEEKKGIIKELFENSTIALIYGSAGTGKTTLMNQIASFFSSADKIFLANTHPAVENLRRKVNANNSKFMTVTSYLSNKNFNNQHDILFIDECSTISNLDMNEVLKKAKYQLIILVGDVCQIESISFGNWFNLAKHLITNTSIHELSQNYRSTNPELQTLWNKVRKLDTSISEWLARNEYSYILSEDILKKEYEDEIILCLNYDGLYGINNINRFLQLSNKHQAVELRLLQYKVDDPILFKDNTLYREVLHNNLKGKIKVIKSQKDYIDFVIDVEKSLTGLDVRGYSNLWLIETFSDGKTKIMIRVNRYQSVDSDNDDGLSIVPFQIAYAVSIHKAQGLEYDSVKIVITSDVDELITHNVFYTAITRAKEKLRIYWTPECENKIIKSMKITTNDTDINILKNKMNRAEQNEKT